LFLSGKIYGILPTIITDVSSTTAALEVSVEPDLYLDLSERNTAIVSSKSLTCILDPIPTRLFKEVFPLINVALPDATTGSFSEALETEDGLIFVYLVCTDNLVKWSRSQAFPLLVRAADSTSLLSLFQLADPTRYCFFKREE